MTIRPEQSVLRDVLIRVAAAGLVQAERTEAILAETFRSLKADRPDLDPDKLDRTRRAMKPRSPLCGALS